MGVEHQKAIAVEIQTRDLALLRGLFESRVMTMQHAAALYFDGSQEAAKKRLQKLKSAGHISERPRRSFDPSVLFLARKGISILSEHGILAEYPTIPLASLERRAQVSDLTIRHELEVMDVKVAVSEAVARSAQFQIAEFSTWPQLDQFLARRPDTHAEVLVKPDGYIRIREKADGDDFEHTFFLEVDRSTETQDTIALKAACYIDYYKSGGLAVRNGEPRTAFKDFPFRVLMVFKNAERRNNAAERMLQSNPPIFTQVWLTTRQEILADPLGPIWMRPVDYRDATKNTRFDPERRPVTSRYVRESERESVVEAKVRKSCLLAEAPGDAFGR
jgi:hypothetical protein